MTIAPDTVDSPVSGTLLVSIVNYNTWDDTVACVRSLVDSYTAQDGIALRVCVWDNGTEQAPAALGYLDGMLRVRSAGRNLGFGRGHNENFRSFDGVDWILILNPDTIVSWGSVALLVKHIAPNRGIVAVAPQLRGTDGVIEISCRRLPSIRSEIARSFGLDSLGFGGTLMTAFDHTTRSYVQQPPGAALLLDANTMKSLGGFDDAFPLYFEDVDLCSRVTQFGRIEFVPESVFVHRREGTARRFRMRATFWIEYSRRIYVRKHFPLPIAFLLGSSGCIGLFLRASIHGFLSAAGVSPKDQSRTVHSEKAKGYLLALISVFAGSREYWLKRMMSN